MLVMGLFAAVFGVMQLILTVLVFRAVFGQRGIAAAGSLLVKIALYAVALYVLMRIFRAFVWAAAIGFGAGFFPALVMCAILLMHRKEGST